MADQEQEWAPARLIPVTGIRGAEEQETRATSALLAVLGAVSEFGEGFTRQFGALKGRVETFTEPCFETAAGSKVRPDGLIRVRRGSRTWVALVEVKTGKCLLDRPQLEMYLDIAKQQEFDCVITISNQIPRVPGEHPVQVDGRKLRKVALHHVPWSMVLTQAIMVKVHKGVRDDDQAWILGELIRYLEHPNAGAADFEDMGEHWVPVREAAIAGTLRETDKKATEVAGRWQQLLAFAVIRLGRELGADVQEVLSRKELAKPELRIASLVARMAERAELDGCIRIPNTIGDLRVVVDLRAQQVRCSVPVSGPTEGRPRTRVNWLLRQLKDAPGSTRIDCYGVRSRTSTSELLSDVRQRPDLLLPPDGREIASFEISMFCPMGVKRGAGRNSFVASVLNAIDSFYSEIVQGLRPWTPSAPRMAERTPPAADEEASSSMAAPIEAGAAATPGEATPVTSVPVFPALAHPET